MKVSVAPLVGYKSLRALNAYSVLLLGMKMLPSYLSYGYEEFLKMIEAMEPKEQENVFREAAQFVELQPDELNAMIGFCSDANGIPFSDENKKNLKPTELVEIIVAVCMEIVKIKIDFVTESEKKNLEISQ